MNDSTLTLGELSLAADLISKAAEAAGGPEGLSAALVKTSAAQAGREGEAERISGLIMDVAEAVEPLQRLADIGAAVRAAGGSFAVAEALELASAEMPVAEALSVVGGPLGMAEALNAFEETLLFRSS